MNDEIMKHPPGDAPRRNRVGWKAHALPLLLTGLAALMPACGPDGPKTNVILITVDTLRPDRLGCYGFPLPTSPALDRFAEKALVFEKAYAQASSTSPSLASLMTSLMPSEAGVPRNGTHLSTNRPTLAQFLGRKGYNTAAFVSNFVIRKGLGFERGFRLYNDKLPSKERIRSHVAERTAEDTVSAVLEWLDAGPREPYFLWIHFQDPHGPYTPPPSYEELFIKQIESPDQELSVNEDSKGIGGIPKYQFYQGEKDRRSYEARYLGEIRYFDDAFARLSDRLEALGIFDRSIVAFSADHGESMGEHDYYYAHGEYAYENQIRVPLLLRAPGKEPARNTRPCALMDFYPTVIKFLGLEVPSHLRGSDLFESSTATRPIFCLAAKTKFTTRNRWAMIWKDKKIIFTEPGDWEFYDLIDDPAEETNLMESALEVAEQYREALLKELGKIKNRSKNLHPIAVDKETLKKLESLGYGGF